MIEVGPALRCSHIIGRLIVCVSATVLLWQQRAEAQLIGIPEVTVQMPAPGEVPDRGPVGVRDRERPELQPQGLQLYGTRAIPAITGGYSYNSNIFATPTSSTSDFLFELRPELTLDSGPRLVSYRFNGYGEYAQYLTQSQLSNLNGGLSLGVSANLAPNYLLESRTGFVYAHQDPASFSASIQNGSIPNLPAYTTFRQEVSAARELGFLGASLDGSYQRQAFENVDINGVVLNQTQLNGNTYSIAPKLSYLVSPPTRMFVQATYTRQDYDAGAIDSNTYTGVVGSEFEFRRLFRGNVSIGYRERIYDDPTIGSVGALTYGLDVAWYPTELMTVKLAGKQDFNDSAVQGTTGTSGVNIKTIQAEVDYEVLRQVILSGTLSYENDAYQAIGRIDNTALVGTKLSYALSSTVSVVLQYLYSTRNSSAPGLGYDRQQVGIALRLQR